MSTEIPESKSPITADEKVKKFQQVFHSSSTNSWDKCWEEGLTPWDLGSPTPVLVHLHNTGSLPKGRALVPGCGSGYDVMAIACAERHVVGLDVSDNAIQNAIELSSGSPNTDHFTFLKKDFFTWCPDQLFDLIFDYTFFCAIEPGLRLLWARKMSDLLTPDGELITLIYPIDDHEGGPPFRVSVADYEEVLHPIGLVATHISDNELAIAPRKGREKLGRWKRSASKSSL
ncbi:S-adenosyl-L-methionine-dependent methyltransferases superfamily protein [Perilla frutescens var. hirtella]|uniref:S-adenosyl-L-methionine-dependent methyltransferases superfamily protein n=1 Tax=Perilla frutescens var. hirtella TaxID=608512 RepID=A0AAD4INB6_PERFH|nr:S-adenosyl-L-methionine-dependent methyltransferases superfamily protein [Perilla frutescens var. hirtella]KAH6770444.1 S-adenosyl-L-methionine-dependent methyltransferases superfamily protein [Perilla frutescens var. hirtella]KAH6815938.1 S-adenosyl-L-methionine-dependent methyltransferases superfamily protein [Perilla frutescens var. frutescens]